MNYHPRYPQPFSLAAAAQLDVPTLAEEITRLQNSLRHLQRTQAELRDALPDPDIEQAIAENEAVIGSQHERIEMLKIALSHHGVDSASVSHYTLDALEAPQPGIVRASTRPERTTFQQDQFEPEPEPDEDGVHL